MRISGLVISAPDVDATRAAWRRLGATDRDVQIEQGADGGPVGLSAVVLEVDDVGATEQLLQRRGLVGDAGGFDLGGLTWRLASCAPTGATGAQLTLDHIVVRTGDAERAAANHGARLGLDLRLDRRVEDHGFRGLFFRCGDAVVEVMAPASATPGPDSFGGLAWRVSDIDGTRERLIHSGAEVSEIRTGRKPGTRVATVRDPDLATPTLLLHAARP